MQKKYLSATVAMGVILSAGQVMAEELWDPHLRGVEEGVPTGALPPEGLYFINTFYVSPNKRINQSSSANPANVKLQDWVEAPVLLWVPGVKVLGAEYATAIVQPFDYTNLSVGGSTELGSHVGTFNTVVVPAMLSWTLPSDFHVKTSFAVYLNDGSSSEEKGHLPSPSSAVPSSMANYTFEPGLAVSWLHDGWNLSAQIVYDTSTADGSSTKALNDGKYQSGDQVAVDYTVAKTIKAWTVGLGAYEYAQLQRDQYAPLGGGAYGPQVGTVNSGFALGPVVGYDFGKVKMEGVFNHPIMIHNDSAGDNFFVRLVVPLT